MKNKDTSWNKVARWYDELLKNDDSYQTKVILPNLLRFLDLRKGEKVYDLACGQGYFANVFARAGAEVVASDLSKKLIETAQKKIQPCFAESRWRKSFILYYPSTSCSVFKR